PTGSDDKKLFGTIRFVSPGDKYEYGYVQRREHARPNSGEAVRIMSPRGPVYQTKPPGTVTGTPIDDIAMSAHFDFVYYCPIEGMGLFQ
ncbi:hypothetical protein BaRGS_00031377, partial [Batillaria attramentaria]